MKVSQSANSSPNHKPYRTATRFTDPFLLEAGNEIGNMYRVKRAIIRLEQEDIENLAIIHSLQLENQKLRSKLKRLRKQANQTDRIEQKFEQVSSIIMESQLIDNDAAEVFEEEEEEEEKTDINND